MIFWHLLVALSWTSYGFSIYLFFSNGEKIWALSIWFTAIISLAAFVSYFLLGIRKIVKESQMSVAKILYPIVAVVPGLLVFPTAFLL